MRWSVLLGRFLRTPAGVIGLALTGAVVALAVVAPLVSPNPFVPVGDILRPPSGEHALGTDQFGRDVFASIAHGARTSLLLVLAVTAVTGMIGTAVGIAAGYRSGLVDDALMRLADMVQSVPRLLFAILAVSVLGTGMMPLVIVLGLTSWTFLARVVRAETLSLRDREFVEAARAVGASPARVALTHVLPNVLPATLVVVALVGSRMILLEAGLAFLGLTDPDRMSWGTLIRNADTHLRVAWWISVFPGLAVVAGILGLNLMSDALDAVLDRARSSGGTVRPRHRPQRTAVTGAVERVFPEAARGKEEK